MPANVTDLDKLRSRSEAARDLRVSVTTLDRMIRRKEIESVRIGSGRGRVYVTERAINDYLDRSTIRARRA